MKTIPVLVLIAIAAVLTVVVVSGCVENANTTDEPVRSIFRIRDVLSETQASWIVVGEIVLIVFLAALITLLILLFRRYRKIEKRALEAGIRERALMKENEMLDRISRTKTEFFQNMSHDFKTPLTVVSTSILNAIDLLDYEMDKAEMRESLSMAQSEIMRMARIVDGALKHAALHDNRQSEEVIDLVPLLRKVAVTYHAFLDRRGNTLFLAVPDVLPLVYSNTDMLLNVLSNLISNANKYTRDGEVTISAAETDPILTTEGFRRYISISVSDTGTGVNPENLANMFKRGTAESGSGLGLSICKAAVEQYGGTISIESEPNKGTKVTFTVPIYDKDTVGIGESKR